MATNLGKRKQIQDDKSDKEQYQQNTSSKQSKMLDSSLDSWITNADGSTKASEIKLIGISDEINDRDSVFIAHATNVTNHKDLLQFQMMIRRGLQGSMATKILTLGKPSHVMCAAKYVGLKQGKTGLTQQQQQQDDSKPEEDFEIKRISDDDGEKFGGDRILKILDKSGALDVGVCVSRWFGGTMLGPVRFTHIENSAQNALIELHKLEEQDELDQLRQKLEQLDKQIQDAAQQNQPSSSQSNNKQEYRNITLDSARRLVNAREKRLEFLNKKRQSTTTTTNNNK